MTQPLVRRRRIALRIALAAGATVVALLLAEVGMRMFGIAGSSGVARIVGVDRTAAYGSWDPDLFWRLPPRKGFDPVDEIGVRGQVFTTPRREQDFRMLCVGDSCTYGLFVRLEEAWGPILERLLQARARGANVETLLAGVPAYSTWQNLALWRRHGGLFEADVTILYVGAWNDMVPAVKARDSEFAREVGLLERHPFWSLRLGRLVWRATHPLPEGAASRAAAAQGASGSVAVERRVSEPEFRSNVRELVALGRRSGVVAAIVPTVETGAEEPEVTRLYRRTLLEVYDELSVPFVGTAEAYRAYASRHPEMGDGMAPFLNDRVHPSAIGHIAIAEAIEPLVLEIAGRRLEAAAAAAVADGPTIGSVEPSVLQPGRRATLRVRGAGFRGAAPPLRVFANDQLVQLIRIVDDATMDLDVEPELLCRPGPVAIVVRSRAGVRVAATSPRVLPWRPRVTVEGRNGRRIARASVDCEAALGIAAWFSPGLLDAPIETRWGRFRLENPAGEHPSGAFTARLGPALSLPVASAARFDPGPSPMEAETELPEGFGTRAQLFAQVQIRWGTAPDAAWLSDAIPVLEALK